MKVNYQDNKNISFNGFYNNKILKKGLEFAASNGTLFAATTTLALSGIRPLAILTTPKTDKQNKKVACAKSITSSINGYIIAFLCSHPLSRGIQRIDKNPQKYLNTETIDSLKESARTLTESKAYSMATQLFKLGLGFFIAAPKAILTAFGTPYILEMFDQEKTIQNAKKPINENISFHASKNKISSSIGKIINNKKVQNFVKKNKDSNFPMHIVAATDTLATATFVQQLSKSKKINQEDKPPLIYNSIISTILSVGSTYLIDYATKKQTNKIIEKIKAANHNDPKLAKYIEGVKIAKPILIAGTIYYILIPIISTFLADRIKPKKN